MRHAPLLQTTNCGVQIQKGSIQYGLTSIILQCCSLHTHPYGRKMDPILVEGNEEKDYNTCAPNLGKSRSKDNQGNEIFDSGFKAWTTCLFSAVINMILFGIVACQGIHLVVSRYLSIHKYRLGNDLRAFWTNYGPTSSQPTCHVLRSPGRWPMTHTFNMG